MFYLFIAYYSVLPSGVIKNDDDDDDNKQYYKA